MLRAMAGTAKDERQWSDPDETRGVLTDAEPFTDADHDGTDDGYLRLTDSAGNPIGYEIPFNWDDELMENGPEGPRVNFAAAYALLDSIGNDPDMSHEPAEPVDPLRDPDTNPVPNAEDAFHDSVSVGNRAAETNPFRKTETNPFRSTETNRSSNNPFLQVRRGSIEASINAGVSAAELLGTSSSTPRDPEVAAKEQELRLDKRYSGNSSDQGLGLG
jgi:hypothetical protein